jgi:hypothetical protein
MKIKEKELETFLEELKKTAVALGITVRFEKGDFKGGYCIVKENKIIVINKLTQTQRKVIILATALKELGIDENLLSPKLKEFIEEMAE